jgi:hypothetical protein
LLHALLRGGEVGAQGWTRQADLLHPRDRARDHAHRGRLGCRGGALRRRLLEPRRPRPGRLGSDLSEGPLGPGPLEEAPAGGEAPARAPLPPRRAEGEEGAGGGSGARGRDPGREGPQQRPQRRPGDELGQDGQPGPPGGRPLRTQHRRRG